MPLAEVTERQYSALKHWNTEEWNSFLESM